MNEWWMAKAVYLQEHFITREAKNCLFLILANKFSGEWSHLAVSYGICNFLRNLVLYLVLITRCFSENYESGFQVTVKKSHYWPSFCNQQQGLLLCQDCSVKLWLRPCTELLLCAIAEIWQFKITFSCKKTLYDLLKVAPKFLLYPNQRSHIKTTYRTRRKKAGSLMRLMGLCSQIATGMDVQCDFHMTFFKASLDTELRENPQWDQREGK